MELRLFCISHRSTLKAFALVRRVLSRMAAVGSTAAFSFAGIPAFGAVVAGLANALAFTGVNILLVAHLTERDTGFGGCVGGMARHRLEQIRFRLSGRSVPVVHSDTVEVVAETGAV